MKDLDSGNRNCLSPPGTEEWSFPVVEFYTIAGVIIILLYQLSIPLFDTPDSLDYRQFANYLYLSYHGLSLPPPDSFFIRTPVYPILLSIIEVSSFSFSTGLRLLHALLAGIALYKLLLAFKDYCNPFWITFSFLFCAFRMRMFFFTSLTEWTCFCFLLLFLAEVVHLYKNRDSWQLFNLSLVASLIVLTRPVLAFMLIFPLIFGYLCRIKKTRIWMTCLAGALPCFVWIGVNVIRFQQATLTPFGGLSLFGITSMIAVPPVFESDDPHLRKLIKSFQTSNRCCSNVIKEAKKDINQVERHYNRNLWELAASIRKDSGWPMHYWNELSREYALRVILMFPSEYLSLALIIFKSQIRFIPLLDVVILFLAVWSILNLSGRRKRPASVFVVTALSVHLIHMAISSLTNAIFARLFLLTYLPLIFSLLIVCGIYINHRKFKRREI